MCSGDRCSIITSEYIGFTALTLASTNRMSCTCATSIPSKNSHYNNIRYTNLTTPPPNLKGIYRNFTHSRPAHSRSSKNSREFIIASRMLTKNAPFSIGSHRLQGNPPLIISVRSYFSRYFRKTRIILIDWSNSMYGIISQLWYLSQILVNGVMIAFTG